MKQCIANHRGNGSVKNKESYQEYIKQDDEAMI